MDKDDDFDDRGKVLHGYSFIRWIKSFTIREKIFFILGCTTLLITLILVIVLGTSNKSANSRGNCMSGVCLQQASFLINHMNQSIDPCEDFYTYACGKFSSINEADSKTRNYINLLSNLKEASMEKVRNILEKEISVERNYSKSAERKLRVVFHSCIDAYYTWKLKGQPLLKIIEDLGGWYLLETWNEELFDRDILLQKVKGDYWANIFFKIIITPKKEVPQIKRIFVSPGDGTLISFYYLDKFYYKDKLDPLLRFIIKVASLLIQDSNVSFNESTRTEKLKTFVDDVMSFEIKLANISETYWEVESERRIITLAELNVQADSFDWISLFQRIFSNEIINGATEIHVHTKFLIEISNLVKTVPNRTFHNYLIWRLIHTYAESLSYDYFQLFHDFDMLIYKRAPIFDVWEYCADLTYRYMNEILNAIFIEEGIKWNNVQSINVMGDDLKSGMINTIDYFQWMDDATKALAKKKLKSLKILYGFSSIVTNRNALDELYNELQVNETNYFQNIVNIKIYEKIILRHLMMDTKNIKQFEGHFLSLFNYEPEYINYRNEIKISSLSIVPPLFHNDLPQFVNYGILGLLLAQQITKSILEEGKDFDETGEEKDWWSKKTVKEFKKKIQCLHYQISTKTVDIKLDDMIHSVDLDPSESMLASHLSLIIAAVQVYKSYKLLMANVGDLDPMLPGLLLKSTYQGLFISMAQVACQSNTEELEYRYSKYYGGIHIRTRVMHMISQIPEFSDVFQCSAHSAARMDHSCDLITS